MSLRELGLTKIVLDIQGQQLGRMYAKEGDFNSRGMLIQVINKGVIKDIPDSKLFLYTKNKKGKPYEIEGKKVGVNLFEVVYPSEMLIPGEMMSEIRIFVGEDNIASKSFIISVDERIFSEDVIVSPETPDLITKILDILHQEEQREINEQERIKLYNKINEMLESGEIGKGEPGADGKDGLDGTDGKDGKDGRDGTDGTDGKDGRDGTDGTDGKDGRDGTDATVTEESITNALGYKPVSEDEVGDIQSLGSISSEDKLVTVTTEHNNQVNVSSDSSATGGYKTYKITLYNSEAPEDIGTGHTEIDPMSELFAETYIMEDGTINVAIDKYGYENHQIFNIIRLLTVSEDSSDLEDYELLKSGSYNEEYEIYYNYFSQINSSGESEASGPFSQVNSSSGAKAEGSYSQVNASNKSISSGYNSQINVSHNSISSGTYSQINASVGYGTNEEVEVSGQNSQINATAIAKLGAPWSQINNSSRCEIPLKSESGPEIRYAQINSSLRVINKELGSSVWGHAASGDPSTANVKIQLLSQTGDINHAGQLNSGHNFTDYAELFPNKTGVAQGYGLLQTIDGHGVRPANEGDQVVGITSATAGVILGETPFSWVDRWSKDEWGALIYHDVLDIDWKPNEEKGETEENRPTITVPKENPEWDPNQIQTKRQDRPDEWTVVGLVGQVYVRLNEDVQPMDYVKPFTNGVGQKSNEPTNVRVMKITQEFDEDKGYKIGFCLLK